MSIEPNGAFSPMKLIQKCDNFGNKIDGVEVKIEL